MFVDNSPVFSFVIDKHDPRVDVLQRNTEEQQTL